MMNIGGSVAVGGGLPLEERRDRGADPACADASHAGAGPGPVSPGRNFNIWIKDHDRMGRGPRMWRRRSWLVGASSRRDMVRRDRQWTRPYTAYFEYAVCEDSNPCNSV